MATEIECPNPDCSTTYDPADTGFQCPDCSTPTPQDKRPEPEPEPESESEPKSEQEKSCDNCGEEVPEDANLCPYCGYEFEGEDSKPEMDCPEPDCDGTIPQGGDFCMQCGHERGEEESDEDKDEDLEDTDVIENEEIVTFNVEGEEFEVIKNDDVVVETDDELPDNSFGLQARKAAANAGIAVEEAKKIHRDHLLLSVEDGTPTVENNGVNPTTFNGESLSQGDRRELSDGDEIELTGVTTITVSVT